MTGQGCWLKGGQPSLLPSPAGRFTSGLLLQVCGADVLPLCGYIIMIK